MKTKNRSTMLGYQLRQPMNQIAIQWPQERRNHFLLNPGIAFPLSADKAVWPTADDAAMSAAFFEDFDPTPFSAPNGLSLFSIRSNTPLPKKEDGVLVALSTSQIRASALRAKHFINEQSHNLIGLDLVGFDVCDDYLISGLSNFGLTEHERSSLQKKFGGSLNQFGLFKNIEDAEEFSLVMNKIAKEHAPFDWIELCIKSRN